MKLGRRRNDRKGWAAIRHYANQLEIIANLWIAFLSSSSGWWLVAGSDGLVTRSLRGQLIGQQPLESFKQSIQSLFSSSIILPPELTSAQRVAAGHSCGAHTAWWPGPGVWRWGRTGPGPR